MKSVIIALVFLSLAFRLEALPPRAHIECMYDQMETCKLDSGPVCAIDDSGITKTFENQCMAYVKACQLDTFFVEVKPGEC